jgi:hypothetical protein
MSKLSYHDVAVYIDGVEYAVSVGRYLTCTSTGGWEFWNGKQVIGGEHSSKQFGIVIAGQLVCGTVPDAKPDGMVDEQLLPWRPAGIPPPEPEKPVEVTNDEWRSEFTKRKLSDQIIILSDFEYATGIRQMTHVGYYDYNAAEYVYANYQYKPNRRVYGWLPIPHTVPRPVWTQAMIDKVHAGAAELHALLKPGTPIDE